MKITNSTTIAGALLIAAVSGAVAYERRIVRTEAHPARVLSGVYHCPEDGAYWFELTVEDELTGSVLTAPADPTVASSAKRGDPVLFVREYGPFGERPATVRAR